MGRIPKFQYEQKTKELEVCNNEREKLKTETVNLIQQNIELKNDYDQLTKGADSTKLELTQRMIQLEKEKQKIEEAKLLEVEKLKLTYNNLMSAMKDEIESGGIQITQLQDKLSVTIVDKIVFNSGEAELNKQGKQILKRVANILKKVSDKQIKIEGHTDNIPIGENLKDKFPSNWELSTSRATTVARYLQDEGNVNPTLLSAAGFSQFKPIGDNSTPEGRTKNRRIEILLVPKDKIVK